MTREKWSLSRKLSAVIVAVVVSVLANGTALLVSTQAAEQARQENCERVGEAFDVFTDRLIAAAGAQGDAEAEAFRVEIHDALGECS